MTDKYIEKQVLSDLTNVQMNTEQFFATKSARNN